MTTFPKEHEIVLIRHLKDHTSKKVSSSLSFSQFDECDKLKLQTPIGNMRLKMKAKALKVFRKIQKSDLYEITEDIQYSDKENLNDEAHRFIKCFGISEDCSKKEGYLIIIGNYKLKESNQCNIIVQILSKYDVHTKKTVTKILQVIKP